MIHMITFENDSIKRSNEGKIIEKVIEQESFNRSSN